MAWLKIDACRGVPFFCCCGRGSEASEVVTQLSLPMSIIGEIRRFASIAVSLDSKCFTFASIFEIGTVFPSQPA